MPTLATLLGLFVPLAAPLQQLSFSVLERGAAGARGDLEIIGPRWMRRPTQRARGEERLYRRLAAAQQRHQELDAQIARCPPKTVAWRSLEHADLKRRKLRCRDECEVLAAQLRQSRAAHDTWQLGSGSYGRVLLGRQHGENRGLVAIKVVPVDREWVDEHDLSTRPFWQTNVEDDDDAAEVAVAALQREARVLQRLGEAGAPGFPRLLHTGRQTLAGVGPAFLMVMECLGPSVDDVWWATTSGAAGFSAPCVLTLGAAMLERLQRLHDAGYCHNDLKPSNFCLGRGGGAAADDLYLVDFGLATAAARPEGATAKAAAEGAGAAAEGDEPPAARGVEPPRAHLGTSLFASVAAHRGRRTRPCDDVEALCYVLVYLAAGRLPWERTAEADAIAAAKASLSAERLTAELPAPLARAVAALWQCARAARAADDGRDEPEGAAWQAACRDALASGRRRLTAAEAAQPHDWVGAGVTWSSEGDLACSSPRG